MARRPRAPAAGLGGTDPGGCEHRRDELGQWLHAQGQDSAAETLYRDWDDFVAFYDF